MGSLRFVPADQNGPAEPWVVLAAWPSLVLLPGASSADLVHQLWNLLSAGEPSLESVVSCIPLRGEGCAESFAVIRFAATDDLEEDDPQTAWSATAVVRGSAAVDLLSVGGSRRFGSGGAQPWALAEFGSVTGVCAGDLPPVPESTLRLPAESRRLDHGIARVARVFWAASPDLFADEAVGTLARPPIPGAPPGHHDQQGADDDTVVRSRSPLPSADRTGSDDDIVDIVDSEAALPAPVPRFHFRVGDGPLTELTGPVVIGRRPQPRRGYSTDSPALVAVESPEGKVSQNHVEFAPVGRTVVITDLRSTNGTVVTVAGAPPRRLRQGDSAVATGSAIVEIGDGNVIHISSQDRENTETTV